MTYTIISDDAWDFPEHGGSPMERGRYETAAEAIVAASALIEEALRSLAGEAKSVEDLLQRYRMFGEEVPFIRGEPAVDFDPYECARAIAEKWAKPAPQRP